MFEKSLGAQKGEASMKRLVIWWVIVLLVLSTITVSTAEPYSIAGTWYVNCNSYRGRMVLREDDYGGYRGRLFLQGRWEEMLDLNVNGERITFRRATADQFYQGRISKGYIHCVFNQEGRGKYSWNARYLSRPGW